MRPALKILLLLPVAAAIAAVNIATNPWAARRETLVLLARRSLTESIPYDPSPVEERYFQAVRANAGPRPDVLIIGSSRSMQVSNACFPGRRSYSAAVSGGDLPDMAAILHNYQRAGKSPGRLVVGVDPYHLQENDLRNWTDLAADYREWLNGAGIPVPPGVWATEAAAWFRAPLEALSPYNFRPGVRALIGSSGPAPLASWRDTDGVRVRHSESRRRRAEALAARVAAFTAKVPSIDRPGPRPAAGRVKTLAALLDSGMRHGSEVSIWLAPFHPAAYAAIDALGPGRLRAIEDLIRGMAAERQIEVIGSFSPRLCGAREPDFDDAIHPRTQLVERVFANAGVRRDAALATRSIE